LLRSFGLSEGEVVKAFKTQPMLFLYADDNIKRKLRFLLDEVKLGVSDVIAHPVILSYSMENCILPRCAVLSLLMKEGKIQREIKLLPALLGCSTVFSTRYVLRHADDVPDVVKAYEGKIKFQGFTHDT
jgi:mTERF domain-containing protein